jgi:hypothetical protein
MSSGPGPRPSKSWNLKREMRAAERIIRRERGTRIDLEDPYAEL